jgi:SNF family Na+-dependent transporter
MTRPSEVERWGTRVGVILAVAGSAVGLGNFLRFPGQAAANGGGAFMIPYLCALIFLGIPIGWAEWTMGRYGGERGFHSTPAILGVVGGGAFGRRIGVLGLVIPIVVYMYYVLIESWCLRYAWAYATGAFDLGNNGPQASAAFFETVSGSAGNGVIVAGRLDTAVVFWVIVFALNLWLVYRGLSRGIEIFCRWAMPAMALCAVVVLIRVLTLGTPDPSFPERSVVGGLGYMWNPAFSRLADFSTWLAAAGQVFFSLSVGFGVILNYASYLRRQDDVVLSGLTASAVNELFEVSFGGLITITAAFVFLGAGSVAGGTFALGFNTLPVVFGHMGGWGRWVGALWFFMLFLAAITSSLSMLQPVKAFLQEALGISRRRAVVLLGALAGLGSFWVIYFSEDLIALDTMDFWVGTFAIFVLAGVQIVCFAWIMGIDRGMAESHRGAAMRIPRPFRFIIRYVAPAYLIVVFVGFAVQSLPGYLARLMASPVALATFVWIGCVTAILLAAIRVGERRWRRMDLDIDGTYEADRGRDA